MLQLARETGPGLPSAARAGQSKATQLPPRTSPGRLPAAAAQLVPVVLRWCPQQACPWPLPAPKPPPAGPRVPCDGHAPAPAPAPLGPCSGVPPSAGLWSPSTREAPLTKRLQPLPWQRRVQGKGDKTIWAAAFSVRESEREPRARGHCFKRTLRRAFSAETRSPHARPGLQEHPNPSLDLLCSTQAQGSHPSRGALHHTTPLPPTHK